MYVQCATRARGGCLTVQWLLSKDNHSLVSFAQALLHQLFYPGDEGLPAFGHPQQQAAGTIYAGITQSSRQLHEEVIGWPLGGAGEVVLVPGPAQHGPQLSAVSCRDPIYRVP